MPENLPAPCRPRGAPGNTYPDLAPLRNLETAKGPNCYRQVARFRGEGTQRFPQTGPRNAGTFYARNGGPHSLSRKTPEGPTHGKVNMQTVPAAVYTYRPANGSSTRTAIAPEGTRALLCNRFTGLPTDHALL